MKGIKSGDRAVPKSILEDATLTKAEKGKWSRRVVRVEKKTSPGSNLPYVLLTMQRSKGPLFLEALEGDWVLWKTREEILAERLMR